MANQIQDKVIARDTYDTIRVYDIEHGIDDMIVYSSWQFNHTLKQRAVIEYGASPFFIDGYDECTELININELTKE